MPILFHKPAPCHLPRIIVNSASPSLPNFFKFAAVSHRHKRSLPSFSTVSSFSSMDSPPEGYRRNVGICLMSPSVKKIFAASRLDMPNAWQMPQVVLVQTKLGKGYSLEKYDNLYCTKTQPKGGVDENEDPRDAAIRELREETGVTSAEIIAEVPHWLTYDFPLHVREKLNQRWGSDWKGQAQKWFLLKFTGNDEEVNLLGDGTEKAEFGEWSWMSPEQVVDHAVDFKKPVYKEVISVFAPFLQ
ncbi:unnamed protein product [Cuscuta europaea]|uniref:Nudix hydrolase domain-containing protein n=2 Tax=Cuscuta europaea TaxID=41803 RepID=A0A9P1EJH2_CUSEU|nr:unnamed protein product [Cuscuta europaea]